MVLFRMRKLCVVVSTALIADYVFSSPTLTFSMRCFDFAYIASMSNQTNEMEISNTGDSPLEIHRVRACCGAAASISTNSIAPGAAATLTVALKPMAKPGPFRKKVTLYTNDPSAPVVEIPIAGEVLAPKVEVKGDEVVVASNSGMSISSDPNAANLSEKNDFFADISSDLNVHSTKWKTNLVL